MARNVPVQVHDEGPVVGRIDGRGDLVGTFRVSDDGSVYLRLDDESRPEFWAQIYIDLPGLSAQITETLRRWREAEAR